MRIVLILLLLANLALFALTRLDSYGGGGEGHRLQEQVQPEKIRILTPQEVAALGPAKTAALPDVCVEWGPFAEADRGRAMSELASLNLGSLVSTRRIARPGLAAQASLVVRDPPPAALARIRDLAPMFAGSEIRVGGCIS